MYNSTAVVCIVPLFVDHAKVEAMKRCMICMGINDVGKAIPVSTIRHSEGLRRDNNKNATKLSDDETRTHINTQDFWFWSVASRRCIRAGQSTLHDPVLAFLADSPCSYIHTLLFIYFYHFYFLPAQLVRGFTLSDLLDKPRSQVPSRLPPGTCLRFYRAY